MNDHVTRLLVDHGGEKGIGDVVCELNAYAALRERHPDALLYSRGSRTLAWGHPEVDGFDETSSDEDFDQVWRLDLHFSQLAQGLRDEVSIFEHAMRANGLGRPAAPPQLYVLPDEAEAVGLEPDRPEDLVIAYSVDSKEPDRRWGEERFAALIRYLRANYGGTYVEIGSGFTAGHVGIGYDLVGQTDLRQTMAVLSSADLFIGNHGGLTHLAGGVGTPVLCPWGASTPYRAYAYDVDSVALETSPDCRHCAWTSHVTPACRETSVFTGRTACTQAISLEAMTQAADAMMARLRRDCDRLRQRRLARRSQARPPLGLARFDRPQVLNPYTNMRLFIGGEAGWGRGHGVENDPRWKKIVAFPDWHNPASAWESLVAAYVTEFDAHDPWVLILSAAPLTGPAVNQLLGDYLRLLAVRPPGPRIMVIFGSLDETERRDLMQKADAYVPLEGPYHVEGVEPLRDLKNLDDLKRLRRG